MYGDTAAPPTYHKKGRPFRVHEAAKQALLEYHQTYPYLYLDELVRYLEEEWDIHTSKPSVCRLLKAHRRSQKKGSRIGPQSQQLRNDWVADMVDLTAEQLVFIDESLFKAQTGWRCMAYGPIGSEVRWHDDVTRGSTWSILPALTVDGYLPCTGVKEGFFKGEDFFIWFTQELLPLCNPFPCERSVIVLDNVNVHLDQRVQRACDEKGCMLKFLPPYSPDYNPIELTFNILKAWMRRHFWQLRRAFEGDFGGFLKYALAHSGCDKEAVKLFRHSTAGYKFEGDYKSYMEQLARFVAEVIQDV